MPGGETAAEAWPILFLPFHDIGSTAGVAGDVGPFAKEGRVADWAGVHSPAGTGAGPDLFYALALAEPAVLDISLEGSGYDTALAVFENLGGAPGTLIAGNDDASGLQSRLRALSLAAGRYFVVVDGFGRAAGDYELSIVFSRTRTAAPSPTAWPTSPCPTRASAPPSAPRTSWDPARGTWATASF